MAPAAATASASTADEFKAQGNAAFAQRRYDDAVRHFTAAIAAAPADHVLYSNRSGAYAARGDYELALEDASKCVQLNAAWPKGYSRKGFAQLQLGDVRGAIQSYEKGLALDPANSALQQGLREAQARDPERMAALQVQLMTESLLQTPKYRRYCEEDAEFAPRLRALLKEVLADPKMLQLALGVCPDPRLKEAVMEVLGVKAAQAAQADPDEEAELRRQEQQRRAQQRRREEEEQRRREEQERLEQAPEAVAAKKHRTAGNEAYKRREFDAALREYDLAIEAYPAETVTCLNNKAAVYFEMGDLDAAIAVCEKALDLRSTQAVPYEKIAKIYNRLATIYRAKNDLGKAIGMLQKALVEDNCRETRLRLAEFEREKTKRDAEAYIDPALAEEHRARGNEFFKKNDYPAAKREYDEGIRRCPTDPKLYANRSATLMKLLDLPGALKDAEKSLELDGSVAKVWARKGNILLLMKNYNKASEAFQAGLRLDEMNMDCMQGLANVSRKVMESSQSEKVDEEQVAHAMADPEIQALLSDPQFNLVLKNLQEDPAALAKHLRNPAVAAGLQKLMAAGIIKVGRQAA